MYNTLGTPANPADDRMFVYFYDANGNVGQLVDSALTTASIQARYEYYPFGGILVSFESSPASANPFKFSTKYRDGETSLYYYGYRYLIPRLGRWSNHDPMGEAGGINLYAFALNSPTNAVDLLGLSGFDIHHDLVLELARLAGICCPEEIAKYANEPDTDYRRPGMEGMLDATGYLSYGGPIGYALAIRKLWIMGKWHFPRSENGEVEPDSYAAQKLMNEGLTTCNLRDFANGLHTYQDSWSHRGRPYLLGWVGHAYGAEEIRRVVYIAGGFPVTEGTGEYGLLTGREAALSSSIDEANLFPDQAREMAAYTWEWLKAFKESCPDACPERCDGTRTEVKHAWFFGGWRERVMTKKTDCGPARDSEADELIRTRWGDGHDVVTTP
jgi:RHS repeat-associated protein